MPDHCHGSYHFPVTPSSGVSGGIRALDGERVSIVEFESEDNMQEWREQADHRQAQELGRKLFCSGYHIQVCRIIHDYSFPKKTGAPMSSV